MSDLIAIKAALKASAKAISDPMAATYTAADLREAADAIAKFLRVLARESEAGDAWYQQWWGIEAADYLADDIERVVKEMRDE